MNTALALVAIAIFFVCLGTLGVIAAARKAIALGGEGAAVLRSAEASDDEKEAAAQRLSGQLLVQFVSISVRVVGAILIPAAVLYALDLAGVASFDAVLEALESWEVILLSLLLTPLAILRMK